MLKKYQKFLYPLIFLTGLLSLVFLIISFPPDFAITLGFLSLPISLLFFPLLAVTLFSFMIIVFKRPVFAGLITGLTILYLLFRLSGLTHPFFLFLLIALFITFLLLFKKEK